MEVLKRYDTEDERKFVTSLYQTIIQANDKSLSALTELSGIAMGGQKEATKLLNDIDEKVMAGELILPKDTDQNTIFPNQISKEVATKMKDTLFIATHPILALRAKFRQMTVSIEYGAPPHTSTWEEFPELTLADAARAIKAAEKKG